MSGALACCWPHPGGTIFTHLNSPSQEALGSSLVTDLGLVPLAGCSGHSLGVGPPREAYREGAFFAPGQEGFTPLALVSNMLLETKKLKLVRSLGTGGMKLPFVLSLCARPCAGHGNI